MSGLFVVVIVLFSGLVLWVAIKIAKAVQRTVDAANEKAAEDNEEQSPYHWVRGSLNLIWAWGIPAAKYVYREWKTAPPNSAEKLLWTMLLAATIAAVMWILIKVLDRFINRDTKLAVQPENALIR